MIKHINLEKLSEVKLVRDNKYNEVAGLKGNSVSYNFRVAPHSFARAPTSKLRRKALIFTISALLDCVGD